MVPGLKSLPYEERLDHLGILEEHRKNEGIVQIYYRYSSSFTIKGWSSTPVLRGFMEPTQGPYVLQLCNGSLVLLGVWPLLTVPYFAYCLHVILNL